MNESKFKTFMMAAKAIGGDYYRGYQRGLRRFFHGEDFGTSAEHEKYLSLGQHGDPRVEIGNGYRDGLAGKPPAGMHGNIGNLNAQGELPADTQLQIRLNSQVKAAFVKQSQKEGLKLSQWAIKALLAACDNKN